MSAVKPCHSPLPWMLEGKYSDGDSILDPAGFPVAAIKTTSINSRWQDEHPDEHWGSSLAPN